MARFEDILFHVILSYKDYPCTVAEANQSTSISQSVEDIH
jgi:hypothetical protein